MCRRTTSAGGRLLLLPRRQVQYIGKNYRSRFDAHETFQFWNHYPAITFIATSRSRPRAPYHNAQYARQSLTSLHDKETSILYTLHATCTNMHLLVGSWRYYDSDYNQRRALSATPPFRLGSTVAIALDDRPTLVHQLWPHLLLETIPALCASGC